MNLQDQVIYRCIHAACARPLPRKVNFCPYCGTGQRDDVVNPAHVARPAPEQYREAVQPPTAPPVPATPPAAVAPAPVPPVLAKAPPDVPPVPRPMLAAAPPRREPIRMRYWLIALASLWLFWLYARPSPHKIEARIETALKAANDCRFNDAQSELIALRMTKATQEQLTRLQGAINAAVPGCEKKKQRIKAWEDTSAAVENLLAAGDFSKAQARLTQFTRRWNEDEDTRRMKEKIASQRGQTAPPASPSAMAPMSSEATPQPQARVPNPSANTAQSVRNLINEAERALAAGDYKGASDKLETCTTMVDAGNRECAAFKVHADRLQREQGRCLASGREWIGDRCQ
ncbi:MAG: hypothetical protein ACJ8GW_01960 [Massilia sp.]